MKPFLQRKLIDTAHLKGVKASLGERTPFKTGGDFPDDENGLILSYESAGKDVKNDSLTCLPTMVWFRESADEFMSKYPQELPQMSFLYFDISNFSTYNERYGYQKGDELLKDFAQRLDIVFAGALVARVSDDHFVAFDYEEGARKKVIMLREMIVSSGGEVQLGLKTGVYYPFSDERDSNLACDRARLACNSIKKHFDKDYRIFDKDLEEDFRLKQHVINNIDDALENGDILVYLQPVVEMQEFMICGFEALSRWDDKEFGLLHPTEYIDVLEEYHKIAELDQYMLRQVCRIIKKAWDDGAPRVSVSVNMSRLDFELCNMVEAILSITDEYGIPHNMIDIEITESALIKNTDFLKAAINELRRAGFKIWLDDFGSGYSSLNVLKDFDFDVLKIDMKFLAGFADSDRTKQILSNVVFLSSSLSMISLTEGVETPEQVEFLQKIGCERAQGFFFGRPMDPENLKRFIREKRIEFMECML